MNTHIELVRSPAAAHQPTTLTKRSGVTRRALTGFVRDDRGMSTVEYVILMVVIVVGAIGVWKNIGNEVKTGLGNAESEMMQLND